MNKSLNTLIGYSIIPAICLFASKLVGILFIANLLSINLQVVSVSDFLMFKFAAVPADLVSLSNYSDLFMFMTMATGFSFVLINSIYFHETHIHVKVIQHLAKYNLLSLVKSSYELYHTGLVWLIFIWLSNIIIALNVYHGNSQNWLLAATLIFALVLTLVFFRDMFKEIELSKYESSTH